MERWRGKVAVVTGASSGIGAAVAEQLTRAGLQVVGFARRKHRIEKLSQTLQAAEGKLYALKVDVTNENNILEGFKWITNNVGPVSIVVNSAGVFQNTNLTNGETSKWKKILDTNVLGLCIVTREAIKNMQFNNISGHIIHINSVSGHYAIDCPVNSLYPASKHAVRALTETLRQELNRIGSKIKISSVSPGYVGGTDLVVASQAEELLELLKSPSIIPKLDCKDVADAVVYVLGTPPHVQVHDIIMRPVGELF